MSELLCLQIAIALWLVHVLFQVLVARSEFGDDYLFSSRDTQRQPKGTVCGRASRALDNYVQNLVPFVALDLPHAWSAWVRCPRQKAGVCCARCATAWPTTTPITRRCRPPHGTACCRPVLIWWRPGTRLTASCVP